MSATEVRESSKQLRGTIAIDVGETYIQKPPPSLVLSNRPGGAPKMVPGSHSLYSLRSEVLETLVHELLHVVQYWVHGGGAKGQARFNEVYYTGQAKVLRKDFTMLFKPEELAKHAYKETIYEQAAFARAAEFIRDHGHDQDTRGRYDPKPCNTGEGSISRSRLLTRFLKASLCWRAARIFHIAFDVGTNLR